MNERRSAQNESLRAASVRSASNRSPGQGEYCARPPDHISQPGRAIELKLRLAMRSAGEEADFQRATA
jgi:hypothetical protein